MPQVSRNPFPGVNPFVEAELYWDDFHGTFLTYFKAALLSALPLSYDVRVEERVLTSELSEDALITRNQHRRSDVAIVERPDVSRGGFGGPAAGTAIAESVELEIVEFEEERAKSLAIRRLGDDELITSIEVLSPSNKAGKGYDAFVDKRRELFAANVNTVDLDLLRVGKRLAFNTPLPPGDFFAFVATPLRKYRTVDCYAWSVRDRLPVIRIPLADPDPDLVLDLAKPYADAFTLGGYPRRLRYNAPLAGWDASTDAWARSVIAEASAKPS